MGNILLGPLQSWSLKNSALPETRLVVGRLELKGDVAGVHVSLQEIGRVRTKDGRLMGGAIAHSAFREDVVLSAIDRLDPEPGSLSEDFERGYKMWHDADRVPTDELPVDLIERALSILGSGTRLS